MNVLLAVTMFAASISTATSLTTKISSEEKPVPLILEREKFPVDGSIIEDRDEATIPTKTKADAKTKKGTHCKGTDEVCLLEKALEARKKVRTGLQGDLEQLTDGQACVQKLEQMERKTQDLAEQRKEMETSSWIVEAKRKMKEILTNKTNEVEELTRQLSGKSFTDIMKQHQFMDKRVSNMNNELQARRKTNQQLSLRLTKAENSLRKQLASQTACLMTLESIKNQTEAVEDKLRRGEYIDNADALEASKRKMKQVLANKTKDFEELRNKTIFGPNSTETLTQQLKFSDQRLRELTKQLANRQRANSKLEQQADQIRKGKQDNNTAS